MADSRFSFEGLIAKNAPEARDAPVVKRGKYDFAVAYPDPASLPIDGLLDGLREAMEQEGADLALYAHQSGYAPLREFVAQKLARDSGIHVSADDIILGDGSGQPIHMICETLLDPGDVVLTEDFVYSGTLGQLRRFHTDIRGIACDQDGMLPDALESAIKNAIGQGKKPKFIYTIPTFQNPQGWTATKGRREAMLRLSHTYGVPILEDDCYVDLRYEGESVPSIYSMDDTGSVMYTGSFSKIIAPGMRLGYMTAPKPILDVARVVKSGGSVNQFAAWAVHRYATGHLDEHIVEINNIQRGKRDAMVAALGENFGSAAEWSEPAGGLFVWLKMQEEADLQAIRDKVLDAVDVGYQSGPLFAPDGVSGKNYARLCFGYNTPEDIREGITRLADAFAREGILNA
ncbi:MAG: PLP-dependent aminotransferase family protein [Chloroflexi bacterium]|nr:PLP-dependent aminotransferase family protein [Chloroflexota bacterium]MCI0790552.1 PLP-dependent aminotransferase family protein [Chloroflexota bacterium]MCI0840374.1 PLP-dependent aminotransferase family protein [Chloroflexota bacterium]